MGHLPQKNGKDSNKVYLEENNEPEHKNKG